MPMHFTWMKDIWTIAIEMGDRRKEEEVIQEGNTLQGIENTEVTRVLEVSALILQGMLLKTLNELDQTIGMYL